MLYITGGSTAVAFDFREGTINIDIAGSLDAVLEHIPMLKEQLGINIELAKPTDFVPCLDGEAQRHVFINTHGKVTFMHFDPYAQVFSKVVRGHTTDIADAKTFIASSMVDATKLAQLVQQIPAHEFLRHPRLTPESVYAAVAQFTAAH